MVFLSDKFASDNNYPLSSDELRAIEIAYWIKQNEIMDEKLAQINASNQACDDMQFYHQTRELLSKIKELELQHGYNVKLMVQLEQDLIKVQAGMADIIAGFKDMAGRLGNDD